MISSAAPLKTEYALIEKAIAQQAKDHAIAGMVGGKSATVASFARASAVWFAEHVLEQAAKR